jgi:hypothetical protein
MKENEPAISGRTGTFCDHAATHVRPLAKMQAQDGGKKLFESRNLPSRHVFACNGLAARRRSIL